MAKRGKKKASPQKGRGTKRPAKSPAKGAAKGPSSRGGQPKRRKQPGGGARTAVNLPPREEGERLQKVLASAGVASRRESEQLIQEGRVEVDGEVVTELGRRVDPFKAKISFDGEPLPRQRRLYFAVNKPEGVVCTARDPSGRPRVTDLLPPDVGRVFNVGRLDMASEGLILLTNDGELANQLTHPRHGVEKIYHVQVTGVPSRETLTSLRKGVYLSDGKAQFANARVKSRRKNGSILEVVLDEGRNREIRRVLARFDHKVQRLTRVAVGPVRLAELPSGAYRELSPEEVRSLRDAVKSSTKAVGAKKPPGKTKRPARGKTTSNARHDKAAPTATSRRVIGGVDPEPSRPAKRKTTGKRRPNR